MTQAEGRTEGSFHSRGTYTAWKDWYRGALTYSTPAIVPIVEGLGDETAAPVLLRRILGECIGRYDVRNYSAQKGKLGQRDISSNDWKIIW